jgi:hypothetical protein
MNRVQRWLLGAVLLLSLPGFIPLRNFGNWLALDEPRAKSQAIVVFGEQVPFRAMEAAKLYREGWAPEVWLTQGEPTAEDTRRVRITWNAVASSRAAIVRYASEDPFDPPHWWRTSTDVL